jgi:CubicO group peptidase (beta-lactamase class C family)
MTDTRFNSDYLKKTDNVATGYAKADFKDLQPAPRMTWGNVSGAGGIYSSVHDMSKWMRMQLAGGVYTDANGKEQRLFSKKRQDGMWSIVTPIPVNDPRCPNSSRPSRISSDTAKAGSCRITAATSSCGTPAAGRAWSRA